MRLLLKNVVISECYVNSRRRGRDLNPRYGCPYAAFRVRCDRPLCHLSEAQKESEQAPTGRPLSNQAGQDRQGAGRVYCQQPLAPPVKIAEPMPDALKFDRIRKELRGICLTLGLVAIVTGLLLWLILETGLTHGSTLYLMPVVIAASRWGIVSAVVAALCGVLASAYFFYPPLYSFRIKDPQEVLDLILFIFVAVVTGQLATRLKRQLEMARQREINLRDLYAFSRRLAVAFDVSDIHAAIEDHLATVMQRKVVLFASARDASGSSGRRAGVTVPEPVL